MISVLEHNIKMLSYYSWDKGGWGTAWDGFLMRKGLASPSWGVQHR